MKKWWEGFNYLDGGKLDIGIELPISEHWCPLCAKPPLIFFEEFTGLGGLDIQLKPGIDSPHDPLSTDKYIEATR